MLVVAQYSADSLTQFLECCLYQPNDDIGLGMTPIFDVFFLKHEYLFSGLIAIGRTRCVAAVYLRAPCGPFVLVGPVELIVGPAVVVLAAMRTRNLLLRAPRRVVDMVTKQRCYQSASTFFYTVGVLKRINPWSGTRGLVARVMEDPCVSIYRLRRVRPLTRICILCLYVVIMCVPSTFS